MEIGVIEVVQEQTIIPPAVAQPISYPAIDAFPFTTVTYGQNQYSVFSPEHQQVLYEALKLRCHTEKELTERRYLTPTQLSSHSQGIRVPKGVNRADFIATPSTHRGARGTKRKVVVLDCEMVGVRFSEPEGKGKPKPKPKPKGNDKDKDKVKDRTKDKDQTCEVSELAQLCAIDGVTGEVLIDMLVQPAQKVSNWRTRYSGLTPAAMRSARSEGRMLWGWQGARAALLKHVDASTVLVGHDLESDLFMLRLAHGRIVDTAVQTAEAVFGRRPLQLQQQDEDDEQEEEEEEEQGSFRKKKNNNYYNNRIWGLKGLAKELLGMNIQVGRKGHDCVEDTLATRELALWCLCNQPELAAWAQDMRELLERQRIEREKKQEEERKKRREEEEKKKLMQDGSQDGSQESAQETTREEAQERAQEGVQVRQQQRGGRRYRGVTMTLAD